MRLLHFFGHAFYDQKSSHTNPDKTSDHAFCTGIAGCVQCHVKNSYAHNEQDKPRNCPPIHIDCKETAILQTKL
jgi:hypothetical protein